MEIVHGKSIPKDAYMKASEGGLCPLEAFLLILFFIVFPIENLKKERGM